VTSAELAELRRLDDARSWLSLGLNWGLVAASFALVAWAPSALSLIVALCVIGSRQLGLAVLMHEAAHGTLLRSRTANDRVGSWLCAYPVWSDLYAYRPYHLRHHAKNWTEADPDLALATPFPITRASFRRKVWRDLSGRTGLKFARARWSGALRRWRAGDRMGRRALLGFASTNLALLALLALSGRPELYLLWIGAWLTTHTLVTRIRSIAEHAMVPEPADELRNTRTTLASWWERLLVAPSRVNYHLEHHLAMTVPHYNLPRLHRLLRQRGVLEGADVASGYLEVLRRATSG
jgi:fatty acid desaturase